MTIDVIDLVVRLLWTLLGIGALQAAWRLLRENKKDEAALRIEGRNSDLIRYVHWHVRTIRTRLVGAFLIGSVGVLALLFPGAGGLIRVYTLLSLLALAGLWWWQSELELRDRKRQP